MKLLYIVPYVNKEGGVERILSLKANSFIEKWGYEVHILTQNNGNAPLFYHFDERIVFHDIILKGNPVRFLLDYIKSLNNKIAEIQPDIILVCDNGLKAYLIPFILKMNIPVVFEMHGSKYVEERNVNKEILSKSLSNLKYRYKDYCAGKFTRFVALSQQSLNEWNVNSGMVITNPCWVESKQTADLKSKQVIAVGRHVYEKGFDRMLHIWKKVIAYHPDWKLSIYGKDHGDFSLLEMAKNMGLENNVSFYDPVKDIQSKYLESSFFMITSRFEAFGMVLIEAMACGLPCIAYDCPSGPRAIIQDGVSGFLVEDGNEDLFVEKINQLIENEDLRISLGENAKASIGKYDIDTIMNQWKDLIESLTSAKQIAQSVQIKQEEGRGIA